MTDFLQLHVLTAYPPSNPNRDDLGRPKSAVIGGKTRQRISSQSLKRAIRTSEAFATALAGHKGDRTQRLGEEIAAHLKGATAPPDKAAAISRAIAVAFGKLEEDKSAHPLRIKQLAFVSPDERRLAFALADKALAGGALPTEKELAKAVLLKADGAVDIAMFGRMLAADADFNRDAAVQVAHAFTTNAVEIEDDYYTAVDDLKKPAEDMGAGFVGEAGFGAGVYYLYVCVNRDLLVKNLDGDAKLAERGVDALVRALATATPTGKLNAYANRVHAEFILAERGEAQPLNLMSAFVEPVGAGDQMALSIQRLMAKRDAFAKVYGGRTREIVLHVGKDSSATLDQVAAFAAGA